AGFTDSAPYALRLWVWENTTNRAPATAACPSPAPGSTNLPLKTTLSWAASDPDGDALLYAVALDTHDPVDSDDPLSVITSSITMTSYDPGPLLPHQQYYWQILASDGSVTTVGPVWTFSTLNEMPTVPSAPQPGDGTVDRPVPERLDWESEDSDGDQLTHIVALGTSDPPPIVASCVTTAYNPEALRGHTTYYWQITATDGISTASGPVWQFTTANREPNVPSLPSPSDGTVGWPADDVTLAWQGGDLDDDPITYTVVLTGSDLPAVEFAPLSEATLSLGSLPLGIRYEWQVSASDGMDTVVGPVWQFTTGVYVYLPLVVR
ncbi:MAG: hypothetical protein JXA89_06510, partial [Anaerolineae bacterium]|nr:hypothetical protein [Anaerolineae bacterium]